MLIQNPLEKFDFDIDNADDYLELIHTNHKKLHAYAQKETLSPEEMQRLNLNIAITNLDYQHFMSLLIFLFLAEVSDIAEERSE
jgi:hypothetical protein